jgi:PKD repeat protein/endonuclease/exonuclease/phosphatase family metal-dependent hydrolase
MFSLRRALGCSVFGLLGFYCAVNVSAQQVKVMQWNVERGLGNIFSNNLPAAKAIARIINYNQPDIVTFNELQTNASINTAAGVIDWVTNNLPYFGTKTGVTFWVNIATLSDGYNRNGSISRYPISGAYTYSDAGGGYSSLRGMESFKVQLSGTNVLQVFHVHLKAGSSGCSQRQAEATVDATNIFNWASTNAFPYIFTGDCNESEDPRDTPECTITSTYHPITTLLKGGKLVDFEPTTLSGAWITWSTGDPSPYTNIRFDHLLNATNRISTSYSSTTACIITGYVFSTMDWAAHGLYTNASSQNLVNDSQTASDHYCVQVNYWFPTSLTNFNVTPTNVFASSGGVGGPFTPSNQVYAVTNSGTIPLFWSVIKTSNWLTVSPLATNVPIGALVSTNVTAIINSAANSLPAGTYVDTIRFSNTATGVTFSRGVTLTVGSSPPTASFTASPTNGTAPLLVTFTDTSTGTAPLSLSWNLGDSFTTNTAGGASFGHTYAAGNYTVTLTASNSAGTSTLVSNHLIAAITPFQAWQLQYFGCTNCPQAAPDADPLGKGMSNTNQFLAGLNPTNPASVFQIRSVAADSSNNVLITWSTAGVRTNAVQATAGDAGGGYSTESFQDLSNATVIINVSGDTATNYTDVGGATNIPSRYYRVRLVP